MRSMRTSCNLALRRTLFAESDRDDPSCRLNELELRRMESGRRPRKRVKPAVDAAAESFSRLVATCTRLTQLVQEDRNASDALQDELAVTADRFARFETALRSVDASAADDLLPEGWRDQLDSFGTSLWNQSTARRYALNQLDDAQRPAARNDVAACKSLTVQFSPAHTALSCSPSTRSCSAPNSLRLALLG